MRWLELSSLFLSAALIAQAPCPDGQCPTPRGFGAGIGGGFYVGQPARPPLRNYSELFNNGPQVTPPSKSPASDARAWVRGMARIRVHSDQGTDFGSAVCVGYGRSETEWLFLTCAHVLETGGAPELLIRGQWVPAKVLYRDKLAPVVNGMRTRGGPDRGVVSVQFPEKLRFSRVSHRWSSGPVALSGYPSTDKAATISGTARVTDSGKMVHAKLQRASQGGFSGGGVFSDRRELVGIWTSGSNGDGYAESIASFMEVFRIIGWKSGNWSHIPFTNRNPVVDSSDTPSEPTIDRGAAYEQIRERIKRLDELVAKCNCSGGDDGASGVGIESARVDKGILVLVLTNGEEITAGSVWPDEDPHHVATGQAAIGKLESELTRLKSTVVPVRVFLDDGSLYSQDAERTLLDPIEIVVDPPKGK